MNSHGWPNISRPWSRPGRVSCQRYGRWCISMCITFGRLGGDAGGDYWFCLRVSIRPSYLVPLHQSVVLTLCPSDLLDKISMILFAFFSSLILTGFLLWCTFTNFPPVRYAFQRWSRQHAGGLTFANAGMCPSLTSLDPYSNHTLSISADIPSTIR